MEMPAGVTGIQTNLQVYTTDLTSELELNLTWLLKQLETCKLHIKIGKSAICYATSAIAFNSLTCQQLLSGPAFAVSGLCGHMQGRDFKRPTNLWSIE